MRFRSGLAVVLLSWWAGVALAQKPVVYTPPEQDFRVLFPAPPSSVATPDGAVAYSAAAEDITFTVYRRNPSVQPIGKPAADIQQRLRGNDDDRVVKRLGKEDADDKRGEFAFQVGGGTVSIHRLFVTEGRYYEAAVKGPRSQLGRTRAAARDFFGSFQIGVAPVAAGNLAKLTPDVICKDRSNTFFRTFCEYSYCLRSQYREQPYCQNLLRLR